MAISVILTYLFYIYVLHLNVLAFFNSEIESLFLVARQYDIIKGVIDNIILTI